MKDRQDLRPVLDALHVPAASQMLVMSKTGIQALYTSPQNPRAIYFNDAVTVGYIHGAPLLVTGGDTAIGHIGNAVVTDKEKREAIVSDGTLHRIAPGAQSIKGSSGFAELFAAQGPVDRRGRSLRRLDLERRLMRYPCSYMVYSAAFGGLPADAKAAVYVRIWDVLSGGDTRDKYRGMAAADRQVVVDILRETIHDLPAVFR